MNGRLAVCAAVTLVASGVMAKDTNFSGTGDWNSPARWSAGVPGAGDTAKITSGAAATIDNRDVAVGNVSVVGDLTVTNRSKFALSGEFRLSSAGNNSPKVRVSDSDVVTAKFSQTDAGSGVCEYAQDGGSFTVTNLVDYYAASTTTARFDNVAATFSGYRWALFRAANPSLWKFTDSVVTNAPSSDFMMGIWGASTGDLVFDHSTFDLAGNGFAIGYGNDTATRPATLRFENGSTVVKRRQVEVGALKRRDSSDPFHGGWGRIVGVNSTWTNAALTRLYLGSHTTSIVDGLGSTGELILSNCTYWAETANVSGDAALCVGYDSNSVGRVQIVDGTFASRFVYCGCRAGASGEVDLVGNPTLTIPGLWIGYAAGGFGKLILHDKTLTDFTYSLPGCGVNHLLSSHRTIEYVNSSINVTKDSNWSLTSLGVDAKGNRDYGSHTFRVVDGSVSLAGSGMPMVGGTSDWTDAPNARSSGLELERSTFSCLKSFIVGRHAGSPGHLSFKDCPSVTFTSAPLIGYMAGAIGSFVNEGSKVTVPEIRLLGAGNDGAIAFYRDGQGAETVITANNKDFRIGDNSGTFDVELGGKLTCGRFFVGMNGTVTGEVRVVEGADISASSSFTLGWKDKDDQATLCLNGGMLKTPSIWPYNGDYACACKIYFDGGMLQATENQNNFIHATYARTAVGAGGAVFDSNGFTVKTAIPLSHDDRAGAPAVDGGVVKKGAGEVWLTGALTFTGGLRVEAGTLDLSSATYSATPSVSGTGTLKVPAGGLTVTGVNKVVPGEPGLTVNGSVSFGPNAVLTCDNPDALVVGQSYTFLTATSVTGTPTISLPKKRGVAYSVVNTGTAIVCKVCKPGMIVVVK